MPGIRAKSHYKNSVRCDYSLEIRKLFGVLYSCGPLTLFPKRIWPGRGPERPTGRLGSVRLDNQSHALSEPIDVNDDDHDHDHDHDDSAGLVTFGIQ
jgi:hypothetical protein